MNEYASVDVGSGSNTTLHAGTSVTLQIASTKSVQAGYATEDSQVSSLYVSRFGFTSTHSVSGGAN